MTRTTLLAWQVGVAFALLAIWHIGSSVPVFGVYFMPKFFFSTPADVLARVWKMFATGIVWKHLWITLTETALAFLIGSVAGGTIGFWFARKPDLAAIFDPFLKAANSLPRVVLAPIFMLWQCCRRSSSEQLRWARRATPVRRRPGWRYSY